MIESLSPDNALTAARSDDLMNQVSHRDHSDFHVFWLWTADDSEDIS
jgi:hypothetical protein